MRKTILIGAVVCGLSVAVLGPLLGLGLALLMLFQRGADMNATAAVTLGLALALAGLAFGLPLAWAGWRGLQQSPATEWRMPAWGWFFVAFVISLVLGQVALSAGLEFVAPIFHILAGALPALMFVSLATHRGADLPSRQRIGALSWGALGSTGLAITAETILVVAALIAAAIWISITNPRLLASLQEMTLEVQGELDAQALGPIMDLFRSPLIMAAVLGSVAIVVPVIEEAMKGLVVPLVMATGATPTRRQAFLLGVVSGAGFALLEGILNGVMALMTPAGWGGLMLVRGGTAAIHCVATGFVALGWYAILVDKKWEQGLAYGALGVAIHGAWNLAAGGQAVTSFLGQGAASSGQGLASVAMLTLMFGVWTFAIVVLVGVSRRPATPELTAGPVPLPPADGL
jgi:hypothetical protein